MFGESLIGFGLEVGFSTFTAMAADIVVRVGPPHAVVERRGPPPAAATSGFRAITIGTAALIRGSREGGRRRHAA